MGLHLLGVGLVAGGVGEVEVVDLLASPVLLFEPEVPPGVEVCPAVGCLCYQF